MKYILLFICVLTGFGFTQNPTDSEPVNWQISTEKIDGSTYLIMKATIKEGWKLFGSFPTSKSNVEECSSEQNPICLEVAIEKGKSLIVGNIISNEEAKEGYDENFETDIAYYTNKVELRQKIKNVPKEKITGYIYYITCNHERCTPPSYADFDIEIIE